jgi:hypothetical protein
MGHADYLKLGDSNAICDTCGFKYKHSELKEDWRGLMLCDKCWEPRHPQEFLRGVPDNPMQEKPRPDPNPIFSGPNVTVSTPGFPGSGAAVKNTNTCPVNIVITGGTVTNVVIAGWPASPILGAYTVAPGDSITITYSGSPSWQWSSV